MVKIVMKYVYVYVYVYMYMYTIVIRRMCSMYTQTYLPAEVLADGEDGAVEVEEQRVETSC